MKLVIMKVINFAMIIAFIGCVIMMLVMARFGDEYAFEPYMWGFLLLMPAIVVGQDLEQGETEKCRKQ